MSRLFKKGTKSDPVSQQRNTVGAAPVPGDISAVQQLHRTLGNQTVKRLLKSGAIQAKLHIGAPDDKYEQEADQVADQVMRTPESKVQCQPLKKEDELQAKPVNGMIQRQAEVDEDEDKTLQAKEMPGQSPEVSDDMESSINDLSGGGQALSSNDRRFFEPRFGRDFSQVRLHSDTNASDLAKAVNARAFTLGHNIVFSQGQYNQGSHSGRQLLAHELTHVVQQGGADFTPIIQRQEDETAGPTAPSDLPREAWTGFEDNRQGRNVNDIDAPPVGPYRGEVGSPTRQDSGNIEFDADARAEVAQTDVFVVRMGGSAGRWASYPHGTIEGALAEAQDIARRYAIARQDEAAHGFRPGGDNPIHDFALPTQWSDSREPDLVWRNPPYTEIGVFRIRAGTPYIASQVAPQPEGEDVAAGIEPRMRRGGAMQIQLTSSGALIQEATIPVPDVPRPDVAATSHEVTEQQSMVPGQSATGTVIRTQLPSGEVVTGTSRDERTLGVPTQRIRALETSRVDPMALNAAARSALQQQIALDEQVIGLFEQEEDPSPAQQNSLAMLRQSLARRRAELVQLHGNAEPTRVRAIIERNRLNIGDEPMQTVGGQRTETALGPGGIRRARTTITSGADAVLEEQTSTTVNLSGITTNQQDRLTTTNEAAGTRRVTSQSQARQYSLSGFSQTDSNEQTEVDSTGATTSTSQSSTRGVRAGGGRLTASTASTSRNELVLEGGNTTATEVTNEASASLVHGAEGSGIAVAGSQTRTVTTGGVETGVRTGGDGSFTVNVVRLDTDPPTYRITTTIHLGASIGVTSQRQRRPEQSGARASAGVSGQASGDMIYSRTLSAEEAERYLGNLDDVASGRTIDGRPEYGLLARARALRLHADADLGAVISSASARSMSDGEEMELNLNLGGDLSIGAGSQTSGQPRTRASVGVSGSIGESAGRRIQVARSGAYVTVTVTVRSESRRSGSVSGSYGVSSASYGGSETEGESSAASFRLDTRNSEEFDTRFSEIATLFTERGLIEYANAHNDLVQARTGGATRQQGETVGLGVGPVGVQIGQTGRRSSEVVTGEGRVTGTQTGGQTTSGTLSVAGREVLRGSTGSDISATVSQTETGDAELNVTLTQTESETDYSQGASEMARQFSERRLEDNVADVLTSGPSDLIDRILGAQSVRLTEYDLDQNDVDGVVRRAGNARIWGHAISRYQLMEPWEGLRRALVNPQPRVEWLEADTTEDKRFARKVAQANALANFMEDYANAGGRDAIVWVLRRWGETAHRESTAEDLATLWEWPRSLRPTQIRYQQLRRRVDGLNRRLNSMLTGDSGSSNLERARRLAGELRQGLQRVQEEILASSDFEQRRAQLEMSQEVSRQRRLVSRRLQRFEQMVAGQTVNALPAEEATPEELLEQRTARHALQEETAQASLPQDASTVDPEVIERVNGIVETLRGQKQLYRQLLHEAYELIPESAGGGAEWFWQGNTREATHKLHEAAQQHEAWIRLIRQLRTLYQAIGEPEGKWLVKPSAQARARALDPDISRLIRYYSMMNEWSVTDIDWQTTVGRWARAAAY